MTSLKNCFWIKSNPFSFCSFHYAVELGTISFLERYLILFKVGQVFKNCMNTPSFLFY